MFDKVGEIPLDYSPIVLVFLAFLRNFSKALWINLPPLLEDATDSFLFLSPSTEEFNILTALFEDYT